RNLTREQQLDYVDAVRCLQNKPGEFTWYWPGAKFRFDDFQGLHINQTNFIHYCVGAPSLLASWHRHLMWLYEQALRNECNYRGAHPYWDWTLDAYLPDGLTKSPLWDPEYGLGGNGVYVADLDIYPKTWVVQLFTIPERTGGGCVTTGPFAQRNVSMGVGNSTAYDPHCLHRDFSNVLFAQLNNSTVIQETMDSSNHWWLDRNIEGYGLTLTGQRSHGGGHLGIGGQVGEMTNRWSSAGDPAFYLHHANVDRLWASWQIKDWSTRKCDISGPDTQFAYPFNFTKDIPYHNVTLQTPLHFTPLAPSIIIEDVMDFYSLNYTYDTFY
ncbi:hypothetical protein B0I35DRAFT_359486, partial [Stachybotrys elegans]